MIGEKINEYRRNKGISQREFAEKIGVTPTSVCMWESGKMTPSPENESKINSIISDTKIETFAGMVYEFRRRNNATIKQVAAWCGVSERTVWKWENNNTDKWVSGDGRIHSLSLYALKLSADVDFEELEKQEEQKIIVITWGMTKNWHVEYIPNDKHAAGFIIDHFDYIESIIMIKGARR